MIFFESELEVENHETMRKFREVRAIVNIQRLLVAPNFLTPMRRLRQACDSGRGGLLFVTRDGPIRNNHRFWGHYCRALIIAGFLDLDPDVRLDFLEDLEFKHRMVRCFVCVLVLHCPGWRSDDEMTVATILEFLEAKIWYVDGTDQGAGTSRPPDPLLYNAQ